MFVACLMGHLPVCEWLFAHGAAADITRSEVNGETPMFIASYKGHLPVCKWLVLNGALNRSSPPTPAAAVDGDDSDGSDAADDEDDTAALGHVDLGIVDRDVQSFEADLDDDDDDDGGGGGGVGSEDLGPEVGVGDPLARLAIRPALLVWAKGLVATHTAFMNEVLKGSVVLPNRRTSPRRRCHLPRLPRVVLERLGELLGVEMGRRLRNAREFAEALERLGLGAWGV